MRLGHVQASLPATLGLRVFKHHGAKEAVFPFDKFPKVDPVLGPEMRSTGEVLGLSEDFALAYYKSQEAAGSILPSSGAVLISLSDKTNLCDQAIEVGQRLQKHLRLGNVHASVAAALGLRCFPGTGLQDLRHRRHCQVLRKGWRQVRSGEQDRRRPPERSGCHPEQAGEPHR